MRRLSGLRAVVFKSIMAEPSWLSKSKCPVSESVSPSGSATHAWPSGAAGNIEAAHSTLLEIAASKASRPLYRLAALSRKGCIDSVSLVCMTQPSRVWSASWIKVPKSA